MAAKDYYHSTLDPRYNQSLPPSPDSNEPHSASYNSHSQFQSSPYGSPTEDTSYRPYAQSQHGSASPYYASGGGGREQEPNPFSDEIPLRQHSGKSPDDPAFRDHLPDDPAIVDAPQRPMGKERINRHKGFFSRKIPWVVYTFTLIQCVVFIAELAKNGVLTGSPIEIHPQINPMLGPSPYVLINMGARFVPCMRTTNITTSQGPPKVQALSSNTPWPCPNTTTLDLDNTSNQCQLNMLCGFGDQAYSIDKPPHQWFRFIIPMFLHAGFIHIGFNMLLQILLGREMELEIGPIRFFIVYISSGIFGFVLGGNFAPEGIASTGASGSLFGVIAIMLLDLLYHWEERRNPWSDLAWIIADIVISLALGLLPGLDNFSHIGGFLMGLVLGLCLLHSPNVLRRRVGADLPPYASVQQARKAMDTGGIRGFVKEPVGFFKGRKPFWWAWWLVRAAALIGVLVVFIVLLENFWKATPTRCNWCEYLSCLNIPGRNWCNIGQLQATTQPSVPAPTSPAGASAVRRDIFGGPTPMLRRELWV